MSEPVKRWTLDYDFYEGFGCIDDNNPFDAVPHAGKIQVVLAADYDLLLSQVEVLTRERDEARESLLTATRSWFVYMAAETDTERDEDYEMMKDALTDKPGAA